MVGGPDEGLTSEQGGAMGESWSDLVAGEFQFAHGYDNGGNIWAIGLYATGNKKVAIRDYAINHNPLTYGEYGFDTTGDEVHADGEIWNATQWRVRQALVEKHDRRFPYSDKVRPAPLLGEPRASSPRCGPIDCPGNRRWIPLMFDSFLLQQGATSMLDARDAMLAADRMRFDGGNQAVMWKAFARSGMGVGASTPNADSGDVEPSFATPSGNTDVRFRPGPRRRHAASGARSSSAPTRPAPRRWPTPCPAPTADAEAPMAPGTYRGLVQSAETGLTRFTAKVGSGGSQTVRITVEPNLAAKASGASVLEASAGSLNADSLIDSTEATNWAGVNEGENVDEKQPLRLGRPRRRPLDDPTPGRQRDAAPGRRRGRRHPARAGRRGPGLGLALHRAAEVRHRGLRRRLRRGRRERGGGSSPAATTRSRASARDRRRRS